MTTHQLQKEFEGKRNLLWEMREEELISIETYEETLNRIKDETFFAIDVACDIAQLPVTTAH